jgi:beta-N-acetylhexosaminidase
MSQTHTHAPLILDIAGTSLSDTDRRRLAHPLTGGMILFARKWVDRAQLTALCADIKSVRQDLLILVDHEGGRVQRFRTDGFTHLPPMRALGALWTEDENGVVGSGALQAMNAATACGFVLASELRALMGGLGGGGGGRGWWGQTGWQHTCNHLPVAHGQPR